MIAQMGMGATLPLVRKPMHNPALYKTLGRNIAAARARVRPEGISQSGLAKRIGLTRGSVANIELGTQRPPVHVIWAIGLALGIEPSSLLPSSTELEAASGSVEITLEPAVERTVLESPRARAWLSMTRAKLESATTESSTKRSR
ncbi:MAG: helix-turn-helix transcriptional regulator [Gemmatimonadetes bacterium]|nr:helix-turn-helix transcriptional regulator [Gemmatimonadota bacterium]